MRRSFDYGACLTDQVDCQDGMATTGVLIQLVATFSAVLHTLVEHCNQVIDILTLDHHQVFDEEAL